MDTAPDNPSTNALGARINVAMVEKAIDVSGYPLQLAVAQKLSTQFSLQEEWSFIDPDSGSIRTVDLVASKQLFEFKEPQPRIRPSLNFVIECKQSDLPYVFFLSDRHTWLPDFPVISGLKTTDIIVTSDDDPSSWAFRPLHVLELDRHPFLIKTVPTCMTFSKCVRKGDDIKLSGSDPYQRLVFPILKAVWHFNKTHIPPSTAYYYDCEIVIGLGVLDAPMVGVRLNASGNKTQLLPWVRVMRHQPWLGDNKYDCSRVFGIDIVHKDYLITYIEQHVKPFAEDFARLALKHAHVLAEARGFIPSMGKNSWTQIECRLQRASLGTSGKRFGATLRRIARIFRKTEQTQLTNKEAEVEAEKPRN